MVQKRWNDPKAFRWHGDGASERSSLHFARLSNGDVAAGVERPPDDPFAAMRHGWVLGSLAFATRLKAELPPAPTPRATRHVRALLRDRPELNWPDLLREV
jgi:hypothetical protein